MSITEKCYKLYSRATSPVLLLQRYFQIVYSLSLLTIFTVQTSIVTLSCLTDYLSQALFEVMVEVVAKFM
jgi:hypothetical protein